jgi:hypothetical protein
VYAAYASHAHQRCKTPGLLGQCWKRWIAGGAGHTQLLLAVERHAMAQSCTLYYHTTVNDSPKACCRRQPHELQPIFYFYYAARLTCDDMALTATWLTSSPCHHRYAMTNVSVLDSTLVKADPPGVLSLLNHASDAIRLAPAPTTPHTATRSLALEHSTQVLSWWCLSSVSKVDSAYC